MCCFADYFLLIENMNFCIDFIQWFGLCAIDFSLATGSQSSYMKFIFLVLWNHVVWYSWWTLIKILLDHISCPCSGNALSGKTVVVATLITLEWKLWEDVRATGVEYMIGEKRGYIANLIGRPIIIQHIVEAQDEDKKLVKIKANIEERKIF